MLMSMLVVASSLLQSPTAPPAYQSRVTLQVRAESGESANSVASYLDLRDMLGSIAPNLVPNSAASAYTGTDRVVLQVSTAGQELLVICASGNERDAVDSGLTQVIEHLRRFEPGQYRARRDQVERARAMLQQAEVALAQIRAAQKKFIADHGAIDPSQRVGMLQSHLSNRTAELAQLEMTVAENVARVDYLRAQLQRLPATVEQTVDVSTGETRMLSKQLDELEQQHAQILVKSGADHEETKLSSAKVAEVRRLLEDRSKARRQVQNDRYAEVEHKLYLVEGDLARDSTRRDLMRKTIGEYEAEIAKLTLIAGEYAQIWSELETAERQLTFARAELGSMERQATGLVGGWFAVIAGPTSQATLR
ncbi:MAG: hypothetical protein IPH13_14185 [Planctomycetes bacterium]|nr:hypothetical protein [Planctomycetota bacterium]MCC7171192.1 hypothetical protein [Planctomycetota bacterium]